MGSPVQFCAVCDSPLLEGEAAQGIHGVQVVNETPSGEDIVFDLSLTLVQPSEGMMCRHCAAVALTLMASNLVTSLLRNEEEEEEGGHA